MGITIEDVRKRSKELAKNKEEAAKKYRENFVQNILDLAYTAKEGYVEVDVLEAPEDGADMLRNAGFQVRFRLPHYLVITWRDSND